MITTAIAKDRKPRERARAADTRCTGDIKIFVCYHNDQPRIQSEVFQPIHVGRSLASDEMVSRLSDCVGDDTGDNISHLNKSYCELTALYWAWKNLPKEVEYVGLMHYRRVLSFAGGAEDIINWPLTTTGELFDEFGLGEHAVRQVCAEHDVVCMPKTPICTGWVYDIDRLHNCLTPEQRVQLAQCGDTVSLYDHYRFCHEEKDLRATIRSALALRPELLPIFDKSLTDHAGRFCNTFVMKREYFDEYMAFLFGVLDRVEAIRQIDGDPNYAPGTFQGRVMGFLAERLLSVYIDALEEFSPECRVKECPIVYVAPPAGQAAAPPERPANTEPYEIFLAADDHFSHNLAVTLTSILENADPDESFRFHVLDGGIHETNRFRIECLVNRGNAEIEFHELDESLFEGCPLSDLHHATKSTYFRYIIPQLTPHVDRALYLDSDLVVESSLRELWETDLSDAPIAAVEDSWGYATHRKSKFGHGAHEPYFNAGVMVLNLAKWREDDVTGQLFATTREMLDGDGVIEYQDQDVLNKLFRGRFKVLPAKWNVQPTLFFDSGVTQYHRYEIDQAQAAPAIVHYSGLKPLQAGCRHPLKERYYPYLAKTPWAEHLPEQAADGSKAVSSRFPQLFARFKRHRFFSHMTAVRRYVLQDTFKFFSLGIRCAATFPFHAVKQLRSATPKSKSHKV